MEENGRDLQRFWKGYVCMYVMFVHTQKTSPLFVVIEFSPLISHRCNGIFRALLIESERKKAEVFSVCFIFGIRDIIQLKYTTMLKARKLSCVCFFSVWKTSVYPIFKLLFKYTLMFNSIINTKLAQKVWSINLKYEAFIISLLNKNLLKKNIISFNFNKFFSIIKILVLQQIIFEEAYKFS